MRHMKFCVSLGVLVLASVAACAQGTVQWIAGAERGMRLARETQRPLLLYVPGGDEEEESDLEDAQDASFRNTTIRGFIRQRYVPVRLRRTNATRRMLERLGASGHYGRYLLVTTPGGKLVGQIQPTDAANRQRLIRELVRLFRAYRAAFYQADLRPVLEATELDAADVRRALEKIREFLIAKADEQVAAILKRAKLSETLRKDVYATLATLSTQSSVDALVKAARQDRDARDALDACTPAGAERMLSELTNDAGKVREYVYEAVVEICNVDEPKAAVFWDHADAKQKRAELDRVRTAVKDAAQRWKARYAGLR